jgi:monoamine oxidase
MAHDLSRRAFLKRDLVATVALVAAPLLASPGVESPGQATSWPLDLTPEEKALGQRGIRERYLQPLLMQVGDTTAPGWPGPDLAELDRVSFAGLLRRRGASPGAVSLLRMGFPDLLGDGADAVSALDLLREAAQRAAAKQSFIARGGTDRLPLALATRLTDRIQYGSPIARIEQDATGMRAVVRTLFAGEHTSDHPGWMPGALASGVRAAREVMGVCA